MLVIFSNDVIYLNQEQFNLSDVVGKIGSLSGQQLAEFFTGRKVPLIRDLRVHALRSVLNSKMSSLKNAKLTDKQKDILSKYPYLSEYQLESLFKFFADNTAFNQFKKKLIELIILNNTVLDLTDDEVLSLYKQDSLNPNEDFTRFTRAISKVIKDNPTHFDGLRYARFKVVANYIFDTEDLKDLASKYGISIKRAFTKDDLLRYIVLELKDKNAYKDGILEKLKASTERELIEFASLKGIKVSVEPSKENLINYILLMRKYSNIAAHHSFVNIQITDDLKKYKMPADAQGFLANSSLTDPKLFAREIDKTEFTRRQMDGIQKEIDAEKLQIKDWNSFAQGNGIGLTSEETQPVAKPLDPKPQQVVQPTPKPVTQPTAQQTQRTTAGVSPVSTPQISALPKVELTANLNQFTQPQYAPDLGYQGYEQQPVHDYNANLGNDYYDNNAYDYQPTYEEQYQDPYQNQYEEQYQDPYQQQSYNQQPAYSQNSNSGASYGQNHANQQYQQNDYGSHPSQNNFSDSPYSNMRNELANMADQMRRTQQELRNSINSGAFSQQGANAGNTSKTYEFLVRQYSELLMAHEAATQLNQNSITGFERKIAHLENQLSNYDNMAASRLAALKSELERTRFQSIESETSLRKELEMTKKRAMQTEHVLKSELEQQKKYGVDHLLILEEKLKSEKRQRLLYERMLSRQDGRSHVAPLMTPQSDGYPSMNSGFGGYSGETLSQMYNFSQADPSANPYADNQSYSDSYYPNNGYQQDPYTQHDQYQNGQQDYASSAYQTDSYNNAGYVASENVNSQFGASSFDNSYQAPDLFAQPVANVTNPTVDFSGFDLAYSQAFGAASEQQNPSINNDPFASSLGSEFNPFASTLDANSQTFGSTASAFDSLRAREANMSTLSSSTAPSVSIFPTEDAPEFVPGIQPLNENDSNNASLGLAMEDNKIKGFDPDELETDYEKFFKSKKSIVKRLLISAIILIALIPLIIAFLYEIFSDVSVIIDLYELLPTFMEPYTNIGRQFGFVVSSIFGL